MQITVKKMIGNHEIIFTDDAKSDKEAVEKLAFITSLPSVGPRGSKNLRFVYRRAQDKYDYYSIIDDDTNMELKFGQSQVLPGKLYTKSWEPVFKGDQSEYTQEVAPTVPATPVTPQTTTPVNPVVGPSAAQPPAPPAPMPAAPVTPQVTAPVAPAPPAPMPAAPVTPQVTAPVAPAPVAPVANNAAVNSVLEKYGLTK